MRTTPASITTRGPRRSIRRPTRGLSAAETRNPKENAPAVKPRSQPNSSRIGGDNQEKAGRALTPLAMGSEATATGTPPLEKGTRQTERSHPSIKSNFTADRLLRVPPD